MDSEKEVGRVNYLRVKPHTGRKFLEFGFVSQLRGTLFITGNLSKERNPLIE